MMRNPAQKKVFHDRELRNEVELLINHRNSGSGGFYRVGKTSP
jgi:hypothetical protein